MELPRAQFPVDVVRRRLSPLRKDRTGAVLIEAAFALPIVIALMLGVVTYSVWLLTAQSLQQVANDAARASLAGLTETERQALAADTVHSSLLQAASIDPAHVSLTTREADGFFTVDLVYDGSHNPVFDLALIPLPTSRIVRSATIEISGF